MYDCLSIQLGPQNCNLTDPKTDDISKTDGWIQPYFGEISNPEKQQWGEEKKWREEERRIKGRN